MTEETKSRWPLVEELFHRALGLECSSEERSSQVRNWADGDEELAREVISLLDSADAVEDSRSRAARSSATDEPVGRVLGGYRIVGLIGKGGMGTVYSAVRAMGGDDAEEQVALKVVRARLSSPLTRQRFLEERRMLATMLHPHIARLLDGGVSEAGEPFFVMEYIHGERLDHYCQKTAHNHIEILKIFQQLLGAVAFAHRNRILHGDLKPSNVLVTAEGQVKLLDFGAAMLLSAQKDEEPVKPLAAFTPEYSSPEQVRGEICSAAADVYSLGALLYRLQTGSVLKAGEKAENKNIDADLEAIIAKATREKLEQRYASVSELDEEITRYIGHRPVLARSGTASYLFKKFLRRHRQGLILLLILAGSLLGAALAAQRQTRIARIQEARARLQMMNLRHVANFLLTDFYDQLSEVQGATETQRRVTGDALHYLDGMSRDASGDFSFEVDLSNAYMRVGNILGSPYQNNLGDGPAAIHAATRAVQIARDALRMSPADALAERAVMASEQSLSEIEFGEGQTQQALTHAHAAAEMGELLVKSPSAQLSDWNDTASVYGLIGDLNDLQGASSLGDRDAAIASYQKSAAISRAALARDPHSMRTLRAIAITDTKIGNLTLEADPTAARKLYGEALTALERVSNPPPSMLRQRAVIHQKLGDCLFFENQFAASLVELRIAESVIAPYASKDKENMRVQQTLATIYKDEGESYEGMNDWRNAARLYRQINAIIREVLRRDANNPTWQEHFAETLTSLAAAEEKLGEKSQAEVDERAGLALALRLADDPQAEADDLDNAATFLLSAQPKALRDDARALRMASHAVAMTQETDPRFLLTLVKAQTANDKYPEARKTLAKIATMKAGKQVSEAVARLAKSLDATAR